MFGQIRLHARISRKKINKRIGVRQTINPIHSAFPFALQDRRAVCLHCRNIAINHVLALVRYSFCNGTKYIRHNFRYPQGVPAVPFLSVQKAFRTPHSTSALHRDILIIAQVSIFRYHSVGRTNTTKIPPCSQRIISVYYYKLFSNRLVVFYQEQSCISM